VHSEAEEELFYHALLKPGDGAGGNVSAASETKDAIKDHNKIREAVAEVAGHRVGAVAWRKAVSDANEANGDHMAEEEREGLTDFRRQLPFSVPSTHTLSFDLAPVLDA